MDWSCHVRVQRRSERSLKEIHVKARGVSCGVLHRVLSLFSNCDHTNEIIHTYGRKRYDKDE